MPVTTLHSKQAVAPSEDELKQSYDRLYQEWMGQHRNTGVAHQMLDLMEVKSGSLLDVACGLGYLLDFANERGAKAYGVDLVHLPLLKAHQENPERALIEANGECLPWPDETFDYITSLGSLEHYINPDLGAREIARILKKDGKAAINLPNSHHIQAIYNVYKTGGVLPDLQDYERFATRVEWQDFLENNGLRVLSVHKFNVGFSRKFKKGREGFWYLFNILYRLFGDRWIPTNLSFSLTYICTKA
ncbi:MAG TPA: class I SAM-dependent methyltransferase [Anaerolineales bacterium]|nr:class I SAM-dependent methyltransferase [Anaerolineales bacterium]